MSLVEIALLLIALVGWTGWASTFRALRRRQKESERRLARLGEEGAQQHLLLHTVVESAPMALVLYADSGRIAFANGTARALFFEERDVSGQNFLGMLERAPPALKEALVAEADGLFTTEAGEPQTWHLSRRDFELGGQPHTLLMVKHLTQDLARREAEVWRKVIRVMSHELNNSVAPISSLLHSARLILGTPEQAHKLPRVLDTIEERAQHLRAFLSGYARLAKPPKPQRQQVRWEQLCEGLQALFPQVRFALAPCASGLVDPAQLQQALINLIQNALEAGGAEQPVLELSEQDGGVRLAVHDRGQGFSPEALANATLPFYTTKERGSGLGLTLSREIVEAHRGTLRVENRSGGGATVSLWVPGPERMRAREASPSHSRLTLTQA